LIECLVLEVTEIYAIIETGGKQYKVTPGATINIERLDVADGGSVELDKVLFIADGEKITVGTPIISGAKVKATVKGEGKADKIIVFHYKQKVRERRKTGHRQTYTKISIDDIVMPEAS
jgi:large subunit ribosomal protein L21